MEKWICSKTALTKVNNFLAHTHCGPALREGSFALIKEAWSFHINYGLTGLPLRRFSF